MDLVGKGIVATHSVAEAGADFPRPERVQFLGKRGHDHLGVRVAWKGSVEVGGLETTVYQESHTFFRDVGDKPLGKG